MKRLKTTQIATHKKELLKKQDFKCGLCRIDLSDFPTRDLCLDHDHKLGHVRSVLCRNCNGIEGKIYNLANRGKREKTPKWFLKRVVDYWSTHADPVLSEAVFHPNHKTEDEKRLLRNKKARLRAAKQRALKNVGKK